MGSVSSLDLISKGRQTLRLVPHWWTKVSLLLPWMFWTGKILQTKAVKHILHVTKRQILIYFYTLHTLLVLCLDDSNRNCIQQKRCYEQEKILCRNIWDNCELGADLMICVLPVVFIFDDDEQPFLLICFPGAVFKGTSLLWEQMAKESDCRHSWIDWCTFIPWQHTLPLVQ